MEWIELPVEEMVERYEGGENIRPISETYGVAFDTVRKRLRAAGIRLRVRGGPLGNNHAHKRGGPLFVKDNGYLCTTDRTGHICRIHRACWGALRGSIPDDHVVHHIDGCKLNNGIENLMMMRNEEHSRLHGLAKGGTHGNEEEPERT